MAGLKDILKQNAPQIVSGVAIGCAVFASVLSAKGALEASRIMSECDILDADATIKDRALVTVRKTWHCFIPAAGALAGCIVLILGSNKLYLLREGELIAALVVADGKLSEYKNSVEKILGGENAKKVDKEKVEEEARESLPKFGPIDGKMWCYEPESKQWFQTTKEALLAAEITANKIFQNDEHLTLNTFLSLFEEAVPVDWGNVWGWYMTDCDGYWDYQWSFYRGTPWIDIQPQMAKTSDGRDYLYLAYGLHPGEPNDPEADLSFIDDMVKQPIPPMPSYEKHGLL